MAAAVLESDGHAPKSEHFVPESEQNPREDHAKVPGNKEEPSEPEPEQKFDTTNDKDKVCTPCLQCCGSGFNESGSNSDPGFWWSKIEEEKIQLKIFFSFFDQKMHYMYPLGSGYDVQATGEAFSPQKRTSSTSKHSSLFLFCGSFFHSGIRIQPTKIDADPDPPQYCPLMGAGTTWSLGNSACRTYLTSYVRRWNLTLRADAWENRMLLLRGIYSNFSAGTVISSITGVPDPWHFDTDPDMTRRSSD